MFMSLLHDLIQFATLSKFDRLNNYRTNPIVLGPNLFEQYQNTFKSVYRKDKPDCIFFTDLGALDKDFDDTAALLCLLSAHFRGLINLKSVVTNFFGISGAESANMLNCLTNSHFRVVQGVFEENDAHKYTNFYPFLRKDRFLKEDFYLALDVMVEEIISSPNKTLVFCTTGVTETLLLVQELEKEFLAGRTDIWEKVEFHFQNMANIDDDGEFNWNLDISDPLCGANTKYDPMSATSLSKYIKLYDLQVVLTTKHLAMATKPNPGFWDGMKGISPIGDYLYEHRRDCAQHWWKTAKHGDGSQLESPKGMPRAIVWKIFFQGTLGDDDGVYTRHDNMLPYLGDGESPLYDPLSIMAGLNPFQFTPTVSKSGNQIVFGNNAQDTGLISHRYTLDELQSFALDGVRLMPNYIGTNIDAKALMYC